MSIFDAMVTTASKGWDGVITHDMIRTRFDHAYSWENYAYSADLERAAMVDLFAAIRDGRVDDAKQSARTALVAMHYAVEAEDDE